jgi:hypothetical protein
MMNSAASLKPWLLISVTGSVQFSSVQFVIFLWYIAASLLAALSIKQFLPPDEGGDIAEDGSIIHPGDWSDECDPWKTRPIDMETDYHSTLDEYDD